MKNIEWYDEDDSTYNLFLCSFIVGSMDGSITSTADADDHVYYCFFVACPKILVCCVCWPF